MLTRAKLTPERRKDAFFALVSAQDSHTMSVGDAERQIQSDFAIDARTLKEIVEEGMENDWLDEMSAA